MPLTDSVRRIAVVLGRLPPPYGPLELPPPISPDEPLDDIASGYAEFLRLADGAVCGGTGDIRLWSAASVRQTPWVADDLPGGAARWCAVADLLENPVLVERATGEVWWFSDLNVVWYTDVELASFAKLADDLAGFIDYLILGPGYAQHLSSGPDDPWLQALSSGDPRQQG
ncbi:hypothetical protein [Micromonospora sp. MA102]|uniref:hypothetical protein n=1 Tax=Micromonospora sp. MA102 TaxID=2952755 RepID=UPI0021C5D293|nr:hypothetical protein [Micromonospora sp. MA102]